MTRPAIRVHVERIVVEGLDVEPRHAARVQAALAGELGRLLAEGGLRPELAAGGAVPSLHGGPLAAPRPGAAPEALGTGIAQAVYGGIGR